MKRLLVPVAIVAFSVMFSIAIVGPLLSTLAEAEGISLGSRPNTSIGVIFALGGLSLAIAQVPFARLADRLGRKWFVFGGSLAVGVTILLIGYSKEASIVLGSITIRSLGWDESTLMLATARTLQGVAAAATWPVLLSILASELPVESMGVAMGVFGASFGLGMSLGPVVGPAIASYSGIHAPFILSAILALVASIASLSIKETRKGIVKGRHVREASIRDPRLFGLGFIAFTLLYAMGALVVIYPKYIIDILGYSLKQLAIAMALASLSFSLLQPLTGKLADLLDRRLIVILSHPIVGLAVLLVGLSKSIQGIYAGMLLFGIAGALTFPAATAILGSIAPKGMEGTYTGIYNAMLSFGVTISPIIVGILADVYGYTLAFASIFPVVLAATLTFLVITR